MRAMMIKAVILGFVLSSTIAIAGQTAKLVTGGKTDWQVFIPARAGRVERFAGAELTRYFKQMSGAELKETRQSDKPGTIQVGLRADLDADDRLAPAKPGYDGYSIAVATDLVIIAGDNERGVLYGVYDLLEKLGCRWFYAQQDPHDKEVVPDQPTLELDVQSWTAASPVKYRICNGSAWFFDMNLDDAMAQLDWAMKCRYNAMGWQSEHKTPIVDQYQRMVDAGLMEALEQRGMFLHGPGHAFDYLLSSEEFMADHPEWFGLRDGNRVPQRYGGAQFCWSNPEARRQFVENTRTFVASCPQIRILYIAPFDGGPACECDECRRVGAGSLLMTLMGEVIESLADRALDVHVEALGGYHPVQEPPTGVDIHPRQRIVWAHWGRFHGEGYDDDQYGRKDNLEQWRQAAQGGMTLCQYYTDNFAEPWILPPFNEAIISDRAYFLKHENVDSVYMLMWPPGYWWNHSLNGYIAGMCFYDASLDPYQVLEDYALSYYGKEAGRLIGRYYEQWSRNVELAYRVKDDAALRHRAMLMAQGRELIDPAVEIVKQDPLLSYRVRKVQKLHRLAEKLAEAHRQRREIQRHRRDGDFLNARRLLNRADAYTDELLDYFLELADLNQGLIDRKEVPGFITLGVKNWLESEAEAIESQDRTVKPNFWGEPLDETEMLPSQVAEETPPSVSN